VSAYRRVLPQEQKSSKKKFPERGTGSEKNSSASSLATVGGRAVGESQVRAGRGGGGRVWGMEKKLKHFRLFVGIHSTESEEEGDDLPSLGCRSPSPEMGVPLSE